MQIHVCMCIYIYIYMMVKRTSKIMSLKYQYDLFWVWVKWLAGIWALSEALLLMRLFFTLNMSDCWQKNKQHQSSMLPVASFQEMSLVQRFLAGCLRIMIGAKLTMGRWNISSLGYREHSNPCSLDIIPVSVWVLGGHSKLTFIYQ